MTVRRPWLLGAGLRVLWGHLREDLARVPGRAWAGAGARLVVGLLVTAVVTIAAVEVGQWGVRHGLQQWDERTLLATTEGFMTFSTATTFESPGNLSYLIPLTALVFVIAAVRKRPLVGFGMVLAYLLARPFIFFGWSLWSRARPDLIASGVAAPGLNAYPSGHAILSTVAYGFLAYVWMRSTSRWGERLLALVLATAWIGVIGFSRVRMGTHWPSDVVAGWVIGLSWLLSVIWALRAAERGTRG